MKTILNKKEIYNFKPSSLVRAVIVIVSPVIAPIILFWKFMFKIKSIKIEIEYV